MANVKATWTQLRDIAVAKSLQGNIQFLENSIGYQIFLVDNMLTYETFIYIDTSTLQPPDVIVNNIDRTDFEDNFQNNSGGAIITDVTTEEGVGTEADVFSDPTGDGLIDLTSGPDTVVSISHTGGIYHISGWRCIADEPVQFTLEIVDDGNLVEVIDVTMAGDVKPGDRIEFPRPIEVLGAADRVIRVVAQRLKSGAASGQVGAGINGFTT